MLRIEQPVRDGGTEIIFSSSQVVGVVRDNQIYQSGETPPLIVYLSGAPIKSVHAGQSYYACFEVANVSVAASGPFRVGGGGLGVRTAPSQAHASLLPGRSREGCVLYSTTPPVGSYRLVLTADSTHRVGEMREDNNDATVVVNIVPR